MRCFGPGQRTPVVVVVSGRERAFFSSCSMLQPPPAPPLLCRGVERRPLRTNRLSVYYRSMWQWPIKIDFHVLGTHLCCSCCWLAGCSANESSCIPQPSRTNTVILGFEWLIWVGYKWACNPTHLPFSPLYSVRDNICPVLSYGHHPGAMGTYSSMLLRDMTSPLF